MRGWLHLLCFKLAKRSPSAIDTQYSFVQIFVGTLLATFSPSDARSQSSNFMSIEATVRSMAACSIQIAKQADSSDIYDAQARLATRKSDRRPSLQASARYGNQLAEEEETTRVRSIGVDATLPLIDVTARRSISADQSKVELEEVRLQRLAQDATNDAIESSVEILIQERELETLKQEIDELAGLVKSMTAAGKIGVGESSSALLSQATLNRNLARLKTREHDLLRSRREFKVRFGYLAPTLQAEKMERAKSIKSSIPTSASIEVLNAELESIAAEVSAEKSYILPRLSLTAGFNSDRGYYPQDAYTVGIQLDLSGLFRSSDIRHQLSAKEQTAQYRKERELKRLENEAQMEDLELSSLVEQIKLLNQAVASANKAKSVSRHKLTRGRITYTEYMQYEEILRDLKRDLIDTRAKRLRLTMNRWNKVVFANPDLLRSPATACLLNSDEK